MGEEETTTDALADGALVDTQSGPADAQGEPDVPVPSDEPLQPACLNCGAVLTGAYCAVCGQRAHLHRSLRSIRHDIVEGAFHFEGKIWRTLPELFFHPGRLTRRYIDGERQKFVAPISLFLFTVFLMFIVFSFTGGALQTRVVDDSRAVSSELRSNNEAAIAQMNDRIAQLEAELTAPDLPAAKRAELKEQIEGLHSARTVVETLITGDLGRIAELQNAQQRNQGQLLSEPNNQFVLDALHNARQHVTNPELLLYKLKTNGYKFSWALVPLSIPFLWVLFFWRRDIHVYDHAVFATYSITFVMMLVILCSLAATAGVNPGVWWSALVFIPPVHLYKQLRGAYALTRFGALVRLGFLLVGIVIVLLIFTLTLLFFGLLT